MTGLVLDGLVVGPGDFRAGPFTLDASPGTFVALIGPNGGGKTSLLRTLAGLDAPRAGKIARPPGTPALLPAPGTVDAPFEAEHLVALGRAAQARRRVALDAADKQAARDALCALGLAHLARRPFDRLSSGQRQIVLLARLRVQDARLCLLDEPTATLDPPATARVEDAMRALAAEGRVVVVATHDLDVASRADLVLAVGDPILAGPPGQVLTPDVLSRLYGVPTAFCPGCGRPGRASRLLPGARSSAL